MKKLCREVDTSVKRELQLRTLKRVQSLHTGEG